MVQEDWQHWQAIHDRSLLIARDSRQTVTFSLGTDWRLSPCCLQHLLLQVYQLGDGGMDWRTGSLGWSASTVIFVFPTFNEGLTRRSMSTNPVSHSHDQLRIHKTTTKHRSCRGLPRLNREEWNSIYFIDLWRKRKEEKRASTAEPLYLFSRKEIKT